MAAVDDNPAWGYTNIFPNRLQGLYSTHNATASPVPLANRAATPRNDPYMEQGRPSDGSSSEKALIDLAKSLAEQVSLSRLPPPEPSVFYGDPMRYPGWKAAFQTLIEHRRIPAAERIHYLKKYLGGQVKDTVEGYFLLPPEDAFGEAKKLLEERYGNHFVVANAFRDRLERWQRINSRDGVALLRYADFLRQLSCCNAEHRKSWSPR